ncbi:MAG: hypothetical protein ACXAEU_06490 [Candidatus Hodarchaeales archaeon]
MSILGGLLLKSIGIQLYYSPEIYLIICIINALHFLEEDYTKVWKVIGDHIPKNLIGDMSTSRVKQVFVTLSHIIIIVSFLFYFPIVTGESWAWIFGLFVALIIDIGNGIVHLAIWLKKRKNTGAITGIFQLLAGIALILTVRL